MCYSSAWLETSLASEETSLLAEEALRSAIADYYKRMGKDPTEILGCDMDCAACHHEHDEHAH